MTRTLECEKTVYGYRVSGGPDAWAWSQTHPNTLGALKKFAGIRGYDAITIAAPSPQRPDKARTIALGR